jgi:hypothetical protein
VVEQVAELVQESERNTSADARHAEVDRITTPKAVGAGLADRRGRPDRHRLEIRVQTVQAGRSVECTLELARERAATR